MINKSTNSVRAVSSWMYVNHTANIYRTGTGIKESRWREEEKGGEGGYQSDDGISPSNYVILRVFIRLEREMRNNSNRNGDKNEEDIDESEMVANPEEDRRKEDDCGGEMEERGEGEGEEYKGL
jgi:hypothetical protein